MSQYDEWVNSTEQQIIKLVQEKNPVNPARYVLDCMGNYIRDKLNDNIKQCKACPFNKHKTIIEGDLKRAYILAISDYPDEEQLDGNECSSPFYHHSCMDGLQYTMNKYFRTNTIVYSDIVHCYPHQGDTMCIPDKITVNKCYPFVHNLIMAMQPMYIIIMGNIALSALCEGKTVLKNHGTWTKIYGIDTLITYNPRSLTEQNDIAEKWGYDFMAEIKSLAERIKKEHPETYKMILKE